MAVKQKEVSCSLCGITWPRDPRLEVACPYCYAPVGSYCRRPSEHSGPAIQFHTAREQRAIDEGFLTKVCDGRSKQVQAIARRKQEQTGPRRQAQRVLFR